MQAASTISNQKEQNMGDKNRYGNCRCCLAIGLHQHPFGMAEMEILMENLNLFLLADPRLPQLLCSDCVTSLHEVQRFRQKVMTTEGELHKAITQGIKQTMTSANVTVQPSENDSLETSVVKMEPACDDQESNHDTDDQESSSKEDLDHDYMAESHQNECSTDMDLCNVKIEQDDDNEVENIQNEPVGMPHMLVADGRPVLSFRTVNIELDTEESEDNQPIPSVTSSIKHINETQSRWPTQRNIVNQAQRNLVFQTQKNLIYQSQNVHKVLYIPQYIKIDGKNELATDNTKIRANIITILKHSTIVPFRFTKSNFFKCFYCEKTFSQFQDLRAHTETDHKDGESDYTILKWLQSRQHKNIHADISITKCKMCEEKFENIDNLVQHLRVVHKIVYHDVENADKGPSHGVIAVHLNTNGIKCHLCDKEMRFYKQLTSHMSEHYNSYECPKCDKKYVTAERMKTHLMTSHNVTVTKCPDCDKTFKSNILMKIHRKHMHFKKNPNVSKCTECTETFPLSQPLKRFEHMEEVHGIKRPVYKCDYCKKVYNTVSSLYRHKQTIHIKPNGLICDICNYTTSDKRTMTRHIDYHNGVKNYECDYCHKRYRTKYSIELHIRIHTKDTKYSCPVCKAGFIQKHCYISHIKSKHPESGID